MSCLSVIAPSWLILHVITKWGNLCYVSTYCLYKGRVTTYVECKYEALIFAMNAVILYCFGIYLKFGCVCADHFSGCFCTVKHASQRSTLKRIDKNSRWQCVSLLLGKISWSGHSSHGMFSKVDESLSPSVNFC